MTNQKQNPVYCALDTPNVETALSQANQLEGEVGGIKLGLEFFLANGPTGVAELAKANLPIFLDLKLHDIPNTVAGAVRSITPLGVSLLTIHTQGGEAMMRGAVSAAKEAAQEAGVEQPKIIGVTILTSLDADDLNTMGVDGGVEAQVVRLATLAKECGLDGVVCSPKEISAIRAALGEEFLLIVPGIRPTGSAAGDQKRVLTPSQAVSAGASILVIGRPITNSADIKIAASEIKQSLIG